MQMKKTSLISLILLYLEDRGGYALRFTKCRHMERAAAALHETLATDANGFFPGRRFEKRPLVLFWVPRQIRSRITGQVAERDPEGDADVSVQFMPLSGIALSAPALPTAPVNPLLELVELGYPPSGNLVCTLPYFGYGI